MIYTNLSESGFQLQSDGCTLFDFVVRALKPCAGQVPCVASSDWMLVGSVVGGDPIQEGQYASLGAGSEDVR